MESDRTVALICVKTNSKHGQRKKKKIQNPSECDVINSSFVFTDVLHAGWLQIRHILNQFRLTTLKENGAQLKTQAKPGPHLAEMGPDINAMHSVR